MAREDCMRRPIRLRPFAYALTTATLVFQADAADLELGAYLASECTTCHRADGEYEGIPTIVGWEEDLFVETLNAYKARERENPVMQTISQRLTDEEMSALAAYFRSIAPKDD